MKHGERTRIAAAVGVSANQISSILKGKRRPSADLAARLEKATNISRCAWLWPDEYPNPLIQTESEDADREPL